ncbi:MAG: hypothetical protein IJB47_01195 [Oscillospiraceae bacterium]|nr:hypothetical protein [Oscillospiraceae bacterium]
MDEQHKEPIRPVNPRRRPRSKMQVFKEAYLPVIIAGVALLLIIIFIIGSITRAVQKKNAEDEASIAASISQAEEDAQMAQLAASYIAKADLLANVYDYQGAIDLLYTFPGDFTKYPSVNDKLLFYEAALDSMVLWDDLGTVLNLSFQLLIADPAQAFSHSEYGTSFNRNFVTTEEFANILQQLYSNDYVLVNPDNIITTETLSDGSVVYAAKPLYLPSGKKPVMLTQTNVNYNYYLIDSDGDMVADANGCGFANKLVWDGAKFTNTLVDSSGNTLSGNFDLVPILEAFIARHPDFSYQGARATLALTGYNGLFGYRTHSSAKDIFGEDAYNAEVVEVKNVVAALQDAGYTLACYTYENISYQENNVTKIQTDLNNWNSEVTPIIGSTDILVYAQSGDISDDAVYSGEKYEALKSIGFRYFLGFCNDGKPWCTVTDEYVRQGRIMVTGANMAHHADWFAGIFNAASVLDSTRGDIPQ